MTRDMLAALAPKLGVPVPPSVLKHQAAAAQAQGRV